MPKVIDLPTTTSMSGSDYLLMESSGGGTKKITRDNALSSAHGTIVTAPASRVMVPSEANTVISSITLTRGVWLIQAQFRLNRAGETYQMYCGISQYPSTPETDGGGFVQAPVVAPASSVALNMTRIVNVTAASKTYYLVIWQDSGSDKNLEGDDGAHTKMSAVKLA